MNNENDKTKETVVTTKPMETSSPLPSPTGRREIQGAPRQQRPRTTSTPGPAFPEPTSLRSPTEKLGPTSDEPQGAQTFVPMGVQQPDEEQAAQPVMEGDSAFLSDEEKEASRRQRLETQRQAQEQLVNDPMSVMENAGAVNEYVSADIYEKNPDGSLKTDLEGNPIVRPEFSASAIEMGATNIQGAGDAQGTSATAQTATAVTSETTQAEAAAQAIIASVQPSQTGEASTATTATIDTVQQAQAVLAQLSQGSAMTVEETQLAQAAQDVIVQDYEASIIPLDSIATTLEDVRQEQPMQAASVAQKLNGLLADMEEGRVPTWARPAVAKVEQALAGRGIAASSVGRDSLFNAIINSAMPIASADAQFEQQTSQSNYQAKVNAILQDSSQNFAARQFNATSENQAAQFMANLRAQVDMQNAGRRDAMAQFNAQQTNNMAQFNVGQQNQMTAMNVQQANALAQSNASLQTQTNLSNTAAQNQATSQNVAAINANAQFNAQQRNSLAQANAQLMQQANLANAGAANNAAMQNQQLLTQVSLSNADAANRTALANAQLQTSVNEANANRITNVDMQNAQLATQLAQSNRDATNQLAMHQASLDSQREQFNAQNANVIAQSNVQWRRQLNAADTAGINQANQLNVANAFNLSAQAQNNLWQEVRDYAHWAEQANENELARHHEAQLRILDMENQSAIARGEAEGFSSVSGAFDVIKDRLISKGADALTQFLFGG